MPDKAALSYRELLQRLNRLDDGYKTEERQRKQQTSVRHLQRIDKRTGMIGRRPDGKPMITSLSVRREGEEKPPVEIAFALGNLGVDAKKFWALN